MTVAPDLLRHLGGAPVASAANFAGWWGRKVWFVDFDSGTTGAYGNDMLSPQKNLKTILDHSDFKAGDVVFIKPRDPGTSDPAAITPATAVNWVIAEADHAVSLIGTGVGLHGYMTRMAGHASAATPTIDVRAPFVNLENLGLRKGSSATGGIVRFIYTDPGTTYGAFGGKITGCHIRLGSSTVPGVQIQSAWYTAIENTIFSSCGIGIQIDASNSVPVGIRIVHCDFDAAIAEVYADIATSGAVTRILIRNCSFNHVLPTGGSPNKYINVASASTGIVADSYFGVADATIANSLTLNGIGNSHLWGASAEIT
jgi:hypothetical protein